MSTAHAIAGIDQSALQSFIDDAYEHSRATFFHDTVPVAHLGLGNLTDVEYDVATPPRVRIGPSASDPPATAPASFDVVVDRMRIGLHVAGDRPAIEFDIGVRASAGFAVEPSGTVVPQLGSVTVSVPNEPLLEAIVAEVLVPFVERRASEELLRPIRVPPLGYGDVELSAPRVSTDDGRMTVTTAVRPAVAAPPPTITWPERRLFIAADFEFVNRLAADRVADVTQSGTWSKKIDLGLGQTTLKADYTATLTNVALQPTRDPRRIAGTAQLDLAVDCYAKRLFRVQGTGSTVVGLTFTASVVENALMVQFAELADFRLNMNFKKVAKALDRQISNFITANVIALRAPLSAVLAAQPPVNVGRLPSFDLDLRGAKLRIEVTDPTVTTTAMPDGRVLLIASGVPDVQPTP